MCFCVTYYVRCDITFVMCIQNVCMMCRWLPGEHDFRTDADFGPLQDNPPPTPRTHAETVASGKAADAWKGTKKGHPRHTTGVNSLCALSFLHLFDVIWDICPDMMHIIKNWFEKLTFKLFTGARVPQWSVYKNPEPQEGAPDYAARCEKYNHAKALYQRAVVQAKKCTFPTADQEIVDRRVKNLVGPAKWIKNSMVYTRVEHAFLF